MSKNYQLKFVEDEVWGRTPKDIQKKKNRFTNLQTWIKKRKKRIEGLKTKMKDLKLERIEWEKERTQLFDELHSFQEKYVPSVSPTQQKGNNYQWSINLKIGILKRKKYLGSNKKVRERLDEIKDIEIFLPKMNDVRNDLMKECNEEVRKIIQKNLIKEMEDDLDGVTSKWKNDELKMWDYLY